MFRRSTRCRTCNYRQGYYRYKTATRGRNRLVDIYCEYYGKDREKIRWIAKAKDGIEEKIKTRPRWCPLKVKKGGENVVL